MAAPETADAYVPRRHLRLSGATKLGIRIIVSAALLAILIVKIPAEEIQPKDTHFGTLTFLAVGLAFTFFGFVLSAWRWQRVFGVFEVRVPLRTLLAHYLAGQFVGNVLPSTIGAIRSQPRGRNTTTHCWERLRPCRGGRSDAVAGGERSRV